MAADGGHILLKRKESGNAPAPEPPVSPGRLLRRAVARAGTALGAALSAIGIEDAELTLDTVLEGLDDRQVLLALDRRGAAIGLAIADLDLRDVLVEVQTLGQVASGGGGASRPVTRADAALVQPLVDAILADLREGGPGTDLPLWAEEVEAGPRLATTREIGATLRAGTYRQVRLSLDPGADGRQCGLTLLLPPATPGMEEADNPGGNARWTTDLATAVMEAPAALTAVLARLRLTLSQVEGLSVGQVLPLPGVTVASVVVESADRATLGTARLGQVAGLRAVRLELPDVPDLGSGLARRGDGPPDAMLVDSDAALPPEPDGPDPGAFAADAAAEEAVPMADALEGSLPMEDLPDPGTADEPMEELPDPAMADEPMEELPTDFAAMLAEPLADESEPGDDSEPGDEGPLM